MTCINYKSEALAIVDDLYELLHGLPGYSETTKALSINKSWHMAPVTLSSDELLDNLVDGYMAPIVAKRNYIEGDLDQDHRRMLKDAVLRSITSPMGLTFDRRDYFGTAMVFANAADVSFLPALTMQGGIDQDFYWLRDGNAVRAIEQVHAAVHVALSASLGAEVFGSNVRLSPYRPVVSDVKEVVAALQSILVESVQPSCLLDTSRFIATA
jgi:hypothetical protein